MVHVLETEQTVGASLDTVFEFFSRPENLARLTPPRLRFAILTPSPVPMRQGAVIDYRLSLGPWPVRWRSLISTYEPPHTFVDEQILGPYDFWHHTHRFVETAAGTLISDRVVYRLPYGLLGELAHRLAVRRQLEGIFAHRRRVVERQFGLSLIRPTESAGEG